MFDLMGVIVTNKPGGSRKVIKDLYDSQRFENLSYDDFYAKYKDYILGKITRKQFWQDLESNPVEKEIEYLDTYEIRPSILSTIEQLKSHFKIVLISNHPASWVDYIYKKYSFEKLFEKIYISGSCGIKKPDKRLFNIVLDDFGIQPSEATLIDDQNKNLLAASELGIRTVRLNASTDMIPFSPNLEIGNVEELTLNNLLLL